MKKTLSICAGLALIAALSATGCGGGSEGGSGAGGAYGGSGSESSAAASTEPGGGNSGVAVVSATTTPKLGKAIVDPEGFTLYDFHKDKGGESACYGACAQAWPPLATTGKPQAGEGAIASKLGTTERKDGTLQVTYAGWPLYTYAGDAGPGETNGNDVSAFGAQWYALRPSGEEAGG